MGQLKVSSCFPCPEGSCVYTMTFFILIQLIHFPGCRKLGYDILFKYKLKPFEKVKEFKEYGEKKSQKEKGRVF